MRKSYTYDIYFISQHNSNIDKQQITLNKERSDRLDVKTMTKCKGHCKH